MIYRIKIKETIYEFENLTHPNQAVRNLLEKHLKVLGKDDNIKVKNESGDMWYYNILLKEGKRYVKLTGIYRNESWDLGDLQ